MKQMTVHRMPELDFACAEALNALAADLTFCDKPPQAILLTSRCAREGKTFVAMHLLRTLAGLQKRVVLLDTDLRRSSLRRQYDIRTPEEAPAGLSHYLAGSCAIDDILYATNIPNAYIVPAGGRVSDPLQRLSSSRMPQLMNELRSRFDIVLADTPPAGAIVDALQVARHCDGALIVVAYNHGRTRDIADLVSRIRHAGCPVLGNVLNNVNFNTFINRMYYYSSERYAAHYGRF